MKNKKPVRGDLRRQYRTRVFANILYSALAACLVEVLLVLNLSALAEYAQKAQWDNAVFHLIENSDVVLVLVYVLLGIAVFTLTFLLLQEKSLAYIDRISDAVRNISEGDLLTVEQVAPREVS